MADELTSVREARARFFREGYLPPDGGYDDVWSEAEFGPVRYAVPNTAARADALRVHDLHHVATGYPTHWRGEAEISAWELGSGLGRPSYAWITVMFGLFTGLVAHLRPTFRAFVRGRRSQNLYGRRFDPQWLDMRLATLRAELKLDTGNGRARPRDLVVFSRWAIAAILFGIAAIPFVIATVLAATARQLVADRCPLLGLALR